MNPLSSSESRSLSSPSFQESISSSPKQQNFIEMLPPELLEKIFSYFSHEKKQEIAVVCSSWRKSYLEMLKQEKNELVEKITTVFCRTLIPLLKKEELRNYFKEQLELIKKNEPKNLREAQEFFDSWIGKAFFVLNIIPERHIEQIFKSINEIAVEFNFEEVHKDAFHKILHRILLWKKIYSSEHEIIFVANSNAMDAYFLILFLIEVNREEFALEIALNIKEMTPEFTKGVTSEYISALFEEISKTLLVKNKYKKLKEIVRKVSGDSTKDSALEGLIKGLTNCLLNSEESEKERDLKERDFLKDRCLKAIKVVRFLDCKKVEDKVVEKIIKKTNEIFNKEERILVVKNIFEMYLKDLQDTLELEPHEKLNDLLELISDRQIKSEISDMIHANIKKKCKSKKKMNRGLKN